MKVKMKMFVSLLIVLAMVLGMSTSAFAGTEGTASNNKKTIGMIEQQLNEYIRENYPDIVVGSTAYIDFLTEQLMFESDEKLAQMDNYEDIKFYASKYLSEANDATTTEEVTLSDGTVILQLKPNVRQQTVSEVKNEIQAVEKFQENEAQQSFFSIEPLAGVYSISKAVSYAQKYAESYNTPTYKEYSADCTNFVSQCLVAGGRSMVKPSDYKNLGTYKTTSYWYSMHWTEISPYHRYGISSSFINVSDFFNYWKTRGGLVISGLTKSELQSKAEKGDIVQLKSSGGWYHSIIITSGKKGDWKYCGHSAPRKDKNISDLKSSTTEYRILRFC